MPVRAFFNSGKACEVVDFARLGLPRWAEILDLTKWIYSVMATGAVKQRLLSTELLWITIVVDHRWCHWQAPRAGWAIRVSNGKSLADEPV
jgi:hypothetical protein